MRQAPSTPFVRWAEHTLACTGYATLSPAMAELFESIEVRLSIGVAIPSADFEAVLYAIYAGPYGDFNRAQVFA